MKKRLFIFMLGLGVILWGWSQPPYTGGQQDGYDSGSIEGDSLPAHSSLPALEFRIYPTLLRNHHAITVDGSGDYAIQRYQLFSVSGALIRQHHFERQRHSIRVLVDVPRQGLYILVIRTQNALYRQKIVVH